MDTTRQLSYDTVSSMQSIINMDRYNGRVNIAEPTDPAAQFRMHEKINVRNTASNYYEALTGNLEWNSIAQVFFSSENIQIIQNGLRAGVHQLSDGAFIIPVQNIDNLKIIMRSIYLQHAEHYAEKITEQVERLNRLVLDYAVPSVYNEAVAYVKYVRDQSSLAVPLKMPLNHDRVYKQLELKRFM